MPIIAIYRGTYSGGEAVAEYVAKSLGYRCVDREVLAKASNSYGIPEAKLDEILEKEPHWWEQWSENWRPYRIVLQAAICDLVQDGELVYHGHMGHELLAGIHHVLKVLLTGPLEYRVQQVKDLKNVGDGRARRFLDQNDRAHSRRLMALFGHDWRDPTRYDFALNMVHMSTEEAGRVIVEASRVPDYRLTVDSERDFRNLAVTARVEAALVMSEKFRNLTIAVKAVDGVVTLSGVLLQHASSAGEIARLVERVPGVGKVVTDFVGPTKNIRMG